MTMMMIMLRSTDCLRLHCHNTGRSQAFLEFIQQTDCETVQKQIVINDFLITVARHNYRLAHTLVNTVITQYH